MIFPRNSFIFIHLSLFIYLIGVWRHIQEYFTFGTTGSVMVGGNRALPGETHDHQQMAEKPFFFYKEIPMGILMYILTKG